MTKKEKDHKHKKESKIKKEKNDSEGINNSSPKMYCRVIPLDTPTKSLAPNNIDNLVAVNYDHDPIVVNNEHFTGHLVFRVMNFDGYNPIDPKTGQPMKIIPSSDYFNGHKRTFSLQISGRFRKEWTAEDIMFGTFFEKPVKMPPGHKIALALAKKIDASMDGDLSLDKPYMCSPLICAMNVARADPIILSSNDSTTTSSDMSKECTFNHEVETKNPNKPLYLPKWEYGGAKHLQENFMETVAAWPESKLHQQHRYEEEDSDPLKEEEPVIPKRTGSLMGFFSRTSSTKDSSTEGAVVTPSQRRSWFLNPDHRRNYTFRPDTLYSFDFNNQYVDLTKMHLKLGITFDVSYYLNGQPVRYQMRSRDGSIIFLTIELGLA